MLHCFHASDNSLNNQIGYSVNLKSQLSKTWIKGGAGEDDEKLVHLKLVDKRQLSLHFSPFFSLWRWK